MKKSYLFLASALVLAGCADNDEYLANEPSTPAGGTTEIAFSMKNAKMYRGTLSGKDAAEKLGNEFIVYGTKHVNAETETAANDAVAFENYKVVYEDNTAGTTASNSANWEYVGKTNAYTTVTPNTHTSQTIKYWDYSADDGYTFTAFSGKDLAGKTNAKIEKLTASEAQTGGDVYDKGYKVTLPAGTSLDGIYFSDRVEVPEANYGNPVVLTFRNLGARVRVGFYETVPGYSVKIDKFYVDDDASAAVTKYNDMADAKTTFAAALRNVDANPTGTTKSNTLTITYGDGTDATGEAKNQPKVSSSSSAVYTNKLVLGASVVNTTLGKSADAATMDQTDGAYTTVYPNLELTTPMLIRCDYTLTSDDGKGEEIHVKNARVVVPTQYCQWKSNYAYTYLFKISENTNGTTGKEPSDKDDPSTGDKEGLSAITFDAVTIDATEYTQENITTVATNNVTSYGLKSASTVTATSEYVGGNDVYFVTSQTTGTEHRVIAPTAIGTDATNAQVYKLNKAATEAEVIAQLTGAKNGVELTDVTGASLEQYVPSADGTKLNFGSNGAVKFTPAAPASDPEYYAYVYCTTKYAAPTYTAVQTGDNFGPTTTYYYKTTDGIYYVASGIVEANFATYKDKLYTQTNAGTAGVYDVKVVKIVK